jgi:hypothetical protein
MNEYRVTKYNPALRNDYQYTGPGRNKEVRICEALSTKFEWTTFKEIGETFSGVVFTREDYDRVENAYVQAAITFLRESGEPSMEVAGLNKHGKPVDFNNGDVLTLEQIGEIMRPALREEISCRLHGSASFIHFDWDFYMYIGVPHPCPGAELRATELSLYVEECESPIRLSLEEGAAEEEAGA